MSLLSLIHIFRFSFLIRQWVDHFNAHKTAHPLATDMDIVGAVSYTHLDVYKRQNQYSTNQEHMPPEHQKYVQWNGERFIHWAGKVGSNTRCV